jgi:hypothetical protein
MMAGLTLGHQKRRTTRMERESYDLLHRLLSANLGRGFFSYDQFDRAPAVYTDASKSRRYAGGGYVSGCGRYRYWRYGNSASRMPIDFLEGDAVVMAAQDLGAGWWRCIVPIYIDNTAFQRSAVKGWSHAARLQLLLRLLFDLSLKFECVFEFHWISTHDNVLADALSRQDGEQWFLDHVYSECVWKIGPGMRHADCGALRCIGKAYSCDVAGDGPVRKVQPDLVIAVAFPRASIYDGLPSELHEFVDELMDNRLKASSLRTVSAARSHWDAACAKYGWSSVLHTDDPSRGAKLCAFVCHMLQDTSLSYESIVSYVWGVRSWVKSMRQADPLFGLIGWSDFMAAVHVRAWRVNEPRRAVPIALLRRAILAVDHSSFWEVQCVVLILVLLFSFTRSESPCAETLTGFDERKNMCVDDFVVASWDGDIYVRVRLKSIKQDPRMERPEAAGNEDWVCIGVTTAGFSPSQHEHE